MTSTGSAATAAGSGKRGSTTRYSILSDPRLSQLFALSSQLEALAQSIDVQPQQPQKTGQQNQPQTQKSKTAGLKQHSGRDYSIHGLETALIV